MNDILLVAEYVWSIYKYFYKQKNLYFSGEMIPQLKSRQVSKSSGGQENQAPGGGQGGGKKNKKKK